jgi:hypothetical protein
MKQNLQPTTVLAEIDTASEVVVALLERPVAGDAGFLVIGRQKCSDQTDYLG